MGPRIDAVVVSYNSRDTLRACVEPLLDKPGVTVTVVDNASTDDSLAVVADLPVRAVDSGRNAGFGFGCNLGMASGTAPLVLFLNPDARIDADDLERLSRTLKANPSVAIAAPQIRDDTGRLIPTQRRSQRAGSTWAQALFLHRLVPRATWANEIIRQESAYTHVAYPEWVSGACMLARRDVLEALDGFDEGFFLYCEDMDLCARVRAAGHRVCYEPGAIAYHEGGHSAARTSLYAVLARSRLRYARKQYGRPNAVVQHLGLTAGAITHIAVAVACGRRAHARGHAAALRALVRPAGAVGASAGAVATHDTEREVT